MDKGGTNEMEATRLRNRMVVSLICVALVVPRSGVADESASDRGQGGLRAFDVRLTDQGDFGGQFVNSQGQALSETQVTIWTKDELAGRAVTDRDGRFVFRGLPAGVYQVIAPGVGCIARLWQPSAAPPAAAEAILLVQGPVVRGQYPPRPNTPHPGVYDGAVMKTLSNPWVFSGLLAAGIAVPIVVSNNDNDGS